jgi:hypothetical protein
MVMCCPLSEPDDYCTVWNEDTRRARKEHVCVECREPIRKGELHQYVSSLFDGSWSSHRTCLLCVEIGDHFSCGRGRIVETLWEDLEANFFPDMRMGGPCMEGLSPAAKMKLVERRMAWYLDQDEINDDAWEDWPKHKDRQRPLREPAPDPLRFVNRGIDYDAPEIYWPRQLQLEEVMREYEKNKEDSEP